MNMKKKTIGTLALFMGTITSFCGCCDNETITSIQSIGGGSCLFVNHNTKDSVLVYCAIGFSHSEYIDVHNGDMLEMTFIPDNVFEKFNLIVTYTLMDGTQHSCTDYNYSYKSTISDWGSPEGKISFNATSTDEDANIMVGGTINVRLLDND